MRYIEACEFCKWHLRVWKRNQPADKKRIPFRCRSWRHEGDCRLWKGAQDFVRIKEAIESLDAWSHVCLTYDHQSEKSITQTFRTGVFLWSMLRKRLVRKYGTIKYIQTWEIHRSGFPHIHLAISNEGLCAAATHKPRSRTDREYGQRNFEDTIQRHATECYFGERGWVEPLKSAGAMAGYLGKLARELTGKGKDYQVPTNAPRHFRRLRASRGLLPPPHKDPDITGELLTFAMPGQ